MSRMLPRTATDSDQDRRNARRISFRGPPRGPQKKLRMGVLWSFHAVSEYYEPLPWRKGYETRPEAGCRVPSAVLGSFGVNRRD